MMSDGDLAVVRRAGRMAALQASFALTLVLLVVGAAVFLVDTRVQRQQIASQLGEVASTADDVTDPPVGMELVLRDRAGHTEASSQSLPVPELLARPVGEFDTVIDGTAYRGLVVDKPAGRVVVLLDLRPYDASRSRLLLALAIAELAGIAASVAVVVLLTRRSIRPLTEALALQRRFVADASHELRAPLTVLHTRIQMLSRRFDAGDTHAAKEQIEALASDTRALAAVIEDLLASASMTAGGAPRERVDLAQLAESVRDTMAEHAESTGVRLVVEHGTDEPHECVVHGSSSALRRALSALVDNALAHQHAGGTITLRVSRRGGRVIVDVQDDGVGIDRDAMSTLFDRFSHGHAHTVIGGPRRYGIGLALVREIATAHRGDITVSQTPGGGATFTLSVPAAE
ncbi:HAMP domain-containing sensor histidine kinase [Mycolicibacterium sp. 120266]|uniref:sensor histidine kinase n=1 Tax=Mycolicibacterium sp. 120266 TaxID=3090601 RepID=UPI00299E5585|nr:HAMP domain-containing sensor histidine kinase [Mycolicibacterium sp. 120266]MDX1872497.1 HAMP domain-containing sensor histidine kinase [Mycolicibacterium sp. 120266]